MEHSKYISYIVDLLSSLNGGELYNINNYIDWDEYQNV